MRRGSGPVSYAGLLTAYEALGSQSQTGETTSAMPSNESLDDTGLDDTFEAEKLQRRTVQICLKSKESTASFEAGGPLVSFPKGAPSSCADLLYLKTLGEFETWSNVRRP